MNLKNKVLAWWYKRKISELQTAKSAMIVTISYGIFDTDLAVATLREANRQIADYQEKLDKVTP